MRLLSPAEYFRVKPLFDGWEEGFLWAVFSGHMGCVIAPATEKPPFAKAVLGDFSFVAGDGKAPFADKLAGLFTEGAPSSIIVGRDSSWDGPILTAFGSRAKRVLRYGMKKRVEQFDRDNLLKILAGLPSGFRVVPIDEELFWRLRFEQWSMDLTRSFRDYEQFRRFGSGFVALTGDRPVAGASACAFFDDGIEVEIDTKEDFRRIGLGLCCGAALVLNCLDRGLYPSWDAANLASVALAEKLGYVAGEPYEAFEIDLVEEELA